MRGRWTGTLAWLLGLAAVAAATCGSMAWAGSASVLDNQGVLSQEEKAAVMQSAGTLPFDLMVVTDSAHDDIGEWLPKLITGPRQAVIGLDTVHRKVRVTIGPGLNATEGALGAACTTGNKWFRKGMWADGLLRVTEGVREAVTLSPAETAAGRAVDILGTEAPSGVSWWKAVCGATAAGLVVWGLMAWRRKRRERELHAWSRVTMPLREETATEYADRQRRDVLDGDRYFHRPVMYDGDVVRPGLGRTYVNSIELPDGAGVLVAPSQPAAPPPASTPHHSSHSSGSDWTPSSSGGSDFGGASSGGSDFGGSSSGGSDF